MTMKRLKVTEFTDKYGATRVIHKDKNGRGGGLKVAQQRVTPSLALNRTVAVKLGQRVKAKRIEAGLTLAGLAIKAGLAAATGQEKDRVWEIENNVRTAGVLLGTLYALAAALGCSASDLLPPVGEAIDETDSVYFTAAGDLRTKEETQRYKYENEDAA